MISKVNDYFDRIALASFDRHKKQDIRNKEPQPNKNVGFQVNYLMPKLLARSR